MGKFQKKWSEKIGVFWRGFHLHGSERGKVAYSEKKKVLKDEMHVHDQGLIYTGDIQRGVSIKNWS